MINKVILLVLTFLGIIFAQSFPEPMPGACVAEAPTYGCSLVNLIYDSSILNSSVLTLPSSYSNANIIIDNSITFDTLLITGSKNLITVSGSINVKAITISPGNSLLISGSAVVSGAVRAEGVIVVTGSLLVNSYTQTSGTLSVQSKNGANGYGAYFSSELTIGNTASLSILGSAYAAASATVSGNLTVSTSSNFTVFGSLSLLSDVNLITGSVAANIITANSLYVFGTVSSAALTTSGEVIIVGTITAGTFTSTGNVTVVGNITVTARYAQSGGYLYLLDGTISSASIATVSTVNIQGSTIAGSGYIGSDTLRTTLIVSSSTVDIGYSPGTLTVNGDWRQSSDSTFNLEVANATTYDTLIVTGSAFLGGKLNCITLGKYIPAENTQFPFLTASTVSGSFSSVVGVGAAEKSWTTQTSSQTNPSTVTATYGGVKNTAVSTVAASCSFLFSAILLAILL